MSAFASVVSPVETDRYRDNEVEEIAPYGSQKSSFHLSYKPRRALRPDPVLQPYFTRQQVPSSSRPSPVYASKFHAASPPLGAAPLFQRRAINIQERPEKKYLCPNCGRGFSQSQGLGRHIKDMHKSKQKCSHCSSFKFSRGRPYAYRNHLETHHPEIAVLEVRKRSSNHAKESLKPHVLVVGQPQSVRPLPSSFLVLTMTIRP